MAGSHHPPLNTSTPDESQQDGDDSYHEKDVDNTANAENEKSQQPSNDEDDRNNV
jgi:hypothetical protein